MFFAIFFKDISLYYLLPKMQIKKAPSLNLGAFLAYEVTSILEGDIGL